MKILRLLPTLAMCLSTLATPCNASPAARAGVPTVRIGVMAPFTGDYASAGEEIRRGVILAEKHLKGKGISLSVIFEDACLPAQGVTSIKKLILQDGIQALVSNYCLISLNAISQILTEHKLLALQNSGTPEKMVEASPYIYSTWPSIEDEVRAIFGQLNEEDFNRMAILFLESPWGNAYAEALKSELQKRGKKPILESSQGFGQHDFRAEVSKLKSAHASVTLTAHTGASLVSFLKQARSLGIPASKVYVPSDADDQEIINAAGVASNGIALMISESPNQSAARAAFETAYVAEFYRPSAPLGRHAYDQTMVTVTALQECKLDQECARDRISKTEKYDGATGLFSLKSNRLAQRIFYRRQVVNEKFEFAPAQVQ